MGLGTIGGGSLSTSFYDTQYLKSDGTTDLSGNWTISTNDITLTNGTLTANDLTISTMTEGSVLFAGAIGAISQDNANLFWDDTNKRLGIGTDSPTRTLAVNGDIEIGEYIRLIGNLTTNFRFLTDQFQMNAGGIVFFDLKKAGQSRCNFNNGGVDVDFLFKSDIGNALFIQGNTGNVGIGMKLPDRLLHIEVPDAVTNTVTHAQRIGHITSGTAAVGFGTGIEFELQDSVGNNDVAGAIDCLWTDATSGQEDADFVFNLMENSAAVTERARLTSAGDFKVSGDYYSNSNQGLSGTMTLDDGVNWRITLTFTGGILTGQTTGASSAATATWV